MFVAQVTSSDHACVQCTGEALCSVHLAAETQLASEVNVRFELATPEEMRALLGRLLESEKDHSNVPSVSLARFLAKNLENEEQRIFEASVEDLTKSPLDKDAVDALRFRVAFAAFEHCKHPDKERALLAVLERAAPFSAYPELDPALSKKAPKLKPGKNGKPMEGLAEMEKNWKLIMEHQAALARHVFAHETACEAIRLLAIRPSAAGQSAALAYYKKVADKSPGFLDDLAKQLLQFHSEVAYRAVIDSLGAYKGGLVSEFTVAGGEAVEQRTWGGRLHDVLAAAVVARGLQLPPMRPGDQLAVVWRRWFAENHGKISPISAEPVEK